MLLALFHNLAALIVYAATLRKAYLMFKSGFDVAVKVFSVVALVIAAIEAGPTQDGASKKAQATAQITAQLDQVLPAWAVPIANPMVGFLVDAGVTYANSTGIFSKSAAA